MHTNHYSVSVQAYCGPLSVTPEMKTSWQLTFVTEFWKITHMGTRETYLYDNTNVGNR